MCEILQDGFWVHLEAESDVDLFEIGDVVKLGKLVVEAIDAEQGSVLLCPKRDPQSVKLIDTADDD